MRNPFREARIILTVAFAIGFLFMVAVTVVGTLL